MTRVNVPVQPNTNLVYCREYVVFVAPEIYLLSTRLTDFRAFFFRHAHGVFPQ